MELGEDIPVLIPFTIIVALFLVALVEIYTKYVGVNELIYFGRTTLATAEAIVGYLSLAPGIVNATYLPPAGGNVSIETKTLYFPEPDFNFTIVLQDAERNITWHWGKEEEGRAVISLPVLIGNETKQYAGTFRMVVIDG